LAGVSAALLRLQTASAASRLERLGIVAIGREMRADLCIAEIGFY
jgi:hypothetical protein